jgi:uncharacterized protein (TIGR03546 family)
MTLIFKQLFNFLKMLNSDTGHNQLAAGLACGLILGFAPFFSLQTALVLILIFVFRIQMGAAFLAAFFFKFVAYLVDPVSHEIGKSVLENPSLRDLFVDMYNMPIMPFTRFNNSIIMGSLVLSIVLAPIMFFVFRAMIIKYRILVVDQFKSTKAWKAFKATSIYNWYTKYDSLYG